MSKTPKRSHRLPYGSGSFYWRERDGLWVGSVSNGWTATGAPRRATVSSRDEQQAWDKLTALRKKIAAGERVSQQSPTVRTWAAEWLAATKPHLRPQGWEQHASRLRRWVIPTIGTRRLSQLTPDHVRSVDRAVLDAGRSATTARAVHSTLHTMLQAAAAEGHDVSRSVLLTRKPPAAVSTRQAIPPADAISIVQAALRHPDGSRWVAALLQGMRGAECRGLTWECVDFGQHRIYIDWQLVQLKYADRAAKTFDVPAGYEVRQLKGGWHLARPKSHAGERSIPMIDWVEQSLQAWRKIAPANPWGLVWPDGQRPLTPDADRKAWYALCDQAEVWKQPGVRDEAGGWARKPVYYVPHEARHTAASLLLAAGVPIEIVQEIMGHSTVAMSRHYQHAFDGQLREALEASARQLGLTGQAGG